MASLTGRLGSWEVLNFHRWQDRTKELRFQPCPMIGCDTRIATIGSCFAAELAGAMERIGLNGAQHPGGLFYTSRTIRQEMERIFGNWNSYRKDTPWRTKAGWVHPFKEYSSAFATKEELSAWSDSLDAQADELFRGAAVVVITLGLVESWVSRITGNHYRQIPHPEVFGELQPEFHRMTVREIREDLERVCDLIASSTGAKIILTVSPVPLHVTFTSLDVRAANSESKSRLRAAVSELVETRPEVHYFHSYEMVVTSERVSDFMMNDGRHVHRHAVDYIIQQFLAQYAKAEVSIPQLDLAWLTPPAKTGEKGRRWPAPLRWAFPLARKILGSARKSRRS